MARILVIDDDADYRAVLRAYIEEKGHTVVEAESADQGMAIFLEDKIDLVVSDLMMPVKSGLDLLRELRQIQADVLLIMITGYPTVDLATSAIKAGAYDFLVKPVDMDQLAAVMSRALKTIDLRANLSTMRGMNVALLISIPFWILAGILARVFLFR
jgi:two-component system, NtrC family, response regulator AtoC